MMSMVPRSLADFVFAGQGARRALLAVLFHSPTVELHVRELSRQTAFSPAMVSKELQRLLSEGVVRERAEGTTRLFRANFDSPIAEELRRLLGGGRPTRASSAATAASGRPRSLHDAAEWGRATGRRDAMLREFLDEFYSAPADSRAVMLERAPALQPGDERANAYHAAVAEHLALSHRLPIPAWVNAPERFLRAPYFPAGLESLKATLLVESPTAFRRRLIFVDRNPLSRPPRNPRA